MTNHRISADLADLLTVAELDWAPSRWGTPTITLPGGLLSITENDGTYFLTALEGRGAIHTEAQFSGIAAQAALLATIDALRAELA